MRITEPGRGTQRRSYTRIPTGAYLPASSLHGTLSRETGWDVPRPSEPHYVDVLVIGAGQAGLAASYELRRRGFRGYAPDVDHTEEATASSIRTYLVLDAEQRPGGAWQHRWPELTMRTVNHIADLPGMDVGHYSPESEAADFVPTYFAEYETIYDLPILRPILVCSVERIAVADGERPVDDDAGRRARARLRGGSQGDRRSNVEHDDVADIGSVLFRVETTAGTFHSRVVINCTGTWTRPFLPHYPGASLFKGQQYHTQDYPGARAFEGQRVMVVGGGISALTHLSDIGDIAKTYWVTRHPPRWRYTGLGLSTIPVRREGRALTPEDGRLIEARVQARVEAGLPPLPVVAETGLPVNDWTESMRKRGLLERRPMFKELTADGARWADGTEIPLDAIIWATGFRAELRHLALLRLRTRSGGIVLDGSMATECPNLYLLGYGPSASTVGARSAARQAVKEITDFFARL